MAILVCLLHGIAEQFLFPFAQVKKSPGDGLLIFGQANDLDFRTKRNIKALKRNNKLHNKKVADSYLAIEIIQSKPAHTPISDDMGRSLNHHRNSYI